ncbi:hypothetical protein [Kribbella capetownensis]|uniref:hypothetical protein n=1 Tax=Kribbella capetownensis TaxID=1572659 RepID=UPI001EE015AF|nr:hypothetical protein [Kribbella capetownensis]
MPTRNLPNDPHLDHLRKQAKTLLKEVRAGTTRLSPWPTSSIPCSRWPTRNW